MDPKAHRPIVIARRIAWIVGILAAGVALVWAIESWIARPYEVTTGSMRDTIACGDHVLVETIGAHGARPSRGQVVALHPPAGRDGRGVIDRNTVAGAHGSETGSPTSSTVHQEPAKVVFVKRVVGIAGDTIELRRLRLYRNGHLVHEPYVRSGVTERQRYDFGAFAGPYHVPKGSIFLLGDDRSNSADSRVWGPVPDRFLVGHVRIVLWPPHHVGGIGGVHRRTGGSCEAR